MNKEKTKDALQRLAERFDLNIKLQSKANINESTVCENYIMPMFQVLGWDVTNENLGNEVVRQDTTKVEGRTKKPDYGFYKPDGTLSFFLEAKKPSISLKDNNEPAYQIRRYGWNANLPISVLTDFEEFVVYDCTSKPTETDKALSNYHKYISYEKYTRSEEFDFLWTYFCKENVQKGSLNELGKILVKKGTNTVDKEFLRSINEWRKYLAIDLSWQNKNLNEDQINFAVTHILDRLIFLRVSEDRMVEPRNYLKTAVKSGNYYQNLLDLFQKANAKYNSGLFDFKKDTITPAVRVENKIIRNIIEELYDSPYEFDYIPVEILGSAYEHFLGKQIKIDEAHRVTIEDKPEVRKAGGVYYTPQYIVEYIVKNTVGKLVEGKTPAEVAKLKIIDPACGSGSFLLGVYGFLLDFHREYYRARPKEAKKDKALTVDGKLNPSLKKQILLNNIYGVDIDNQAVEVSKLSLLLKCLEGETQNSINQQLKMFHERALPTLDGNIRCGNSLINTDFFDGKIDFESEKYRKIKSFNWKRAFPDIFSGGGFDCVVGNPPYLSTKRGFAEETDVRNYLKTHYQTAVKQFDAYSIFIEKSVQILKESGIWGFIIPKPVLSNENMLLLRKFILNSGSIITIGDVGMPFKDANVEAVVVCQSKKKRTDNSVLISMFGEKDTEENYVNQSVFLSNPNCCFTLKTNLETESILKKIESGADVVRLKDVVKVFVRGIEAGKKDESIKNVKTTTSKRLLRGQDVSRYSIEHQNTYVEVDYKDMTKFKPASVYEVEKKLLIRRVGSDLQATIDEYGYWNLNTIYNVHLENNDYEFLLGVFNSKLISFWFKNRFVFEDKLFPYARISQIGEIPLKIVNKINVGIKNDIVHWVNRILDLQKQKQEFVLPYDKERLEDFIMEADAQIDKLVYQLYNLTSKEISIVEGKGTDLTHNISAIEVKKLRVTKA